MSGSTFFAMLLAFLQAARTGARAGPEQDLSIRVICDRDRVEFGKAFALEVRRTWSKELVPEAWDEQALAPLLVRLAARTRRDDGQRIEETWQYRCYAFVRGSLTVPAATLRARPQGGGPWRVVRGKELPLEVLSALPADGPGAVELPRGPFAAPFPWRFWSLMAALGLAFSALGFYYVSRRGRVEDRLPEEPPCPADLRALASLASLREQEPSGFEELRADAVETSALLRAYLAERFSLDTRERTSEEVLANPQTELALPPRQREGLQDLLRAFDGVKFARHAPASDERRQQLQALERFVLETRGNGSGAA